MGTSAESDKIYDVIIIGAGHAGLSASYLLNCHQKDHLVIEKGTIGESWKSRRWDSFKLNTPNWAITFLVMTFFLQFSRMNSVLLIQAISIVYK